MGQCNSHNKLSKNGSDSKLKILPDSSERITPRNCTSSKMLKKTMKINMSSSYISEKSSSPKAYKRNNITNFSKTQVKITNNKIFKSSSKNLLKINPKSRYNVKGLILSEKNYNIFSVISKNSKKARIMKEIKTNSETNELELYDKIKKIDSPFISRLYEAFRFLDKFYLILENSCASLHDKIKTEETSGFSEFQIGFIIYQVLLGILYLHKNNIVHRNIKPESVLIFGEFLQEDTKLHFVKLGKLFCCTKIEENNILTEFIGTSLFIAPEVINEKYNEKCDIWSLGVMMHLLLFDKAPFEGLTPEEIFKKTLNDDIILDDSARYSKECIRFLSKLLEKDHSKRISAKKALKNKWFRLLKIDEIFYIDQINTSKIILNFTNFKINLKRSVIEFLCQNLNMNSKLFEIYKIFVKIDQNHVGKISKYEMLEFLAIHDLNTSFNIDSDAIEKIFSDESLEEKGFLSIAEFTVRVFDKEMALADESIELIYNYFGNTFKFQDYENLTKIFIEIKNEEIEKIETIYKERNLKRDDRIELDVFILISKELIKEVRI